MLDVVRRAGKHGIRSDLLFERVYGEDPNGGPETGVKVLAVHARQMNMVMKPKGWRIYSLTRGRCGYGQYVVSKF